jgi:hypothetical protein
MTRRGKYALAAAVAVAALAVVAWWILAAGQIGRREAIDRQMEASIAAAARPLYDREGVVRTALDPEILRHYVAAAAPSLDALSASALAWRRGTAASLVLPFFRKRRAEALDRVVDVETKRRDAAVRALQLTSAWTDATARAARAAAAAFHETVEVLQPASDDADYDRALRNLHHARVQLAALRARLAAPPAAADLAEPFRHAIVAHLDARLGRQTRTIAGAAAEAAEAKRELSRAKAQSEAALKEGGRLIEKTDRVVGAVYPALKTAAKSAANVRSFLALLNRPLPGGDAKAAPVTTLTLLARVEPRVVITASILSKACDAIDAAKGAVDPLTRTVVPLAHGCREFQRHHRRRDLIKIIDGAGAARALLDRCGAVSEDALRALRSAHHGVAVFARLAATANFARSTLERAAKHTNVMISVLERPLAAVRLSMKTTNRVLETVQTLDATYVQNVALARSRLASEVLSERPRLTVHQKGQSPRMVES